MDLIDRLKQAKAIIANPDGWGQGEDRNGACALDALRVNVDETSDEAEVAEGCRALIAALPSSFEPDDGNWNHPVAQFNDAPETTHADVVDLYDRAIAKAEGRRNG